MEVHGCLRRHDVGQVVLWQQDINGYLVVKIWVNDTFLLSSGCVWHLLKNASVWHICISKWCVSGIRCGKGGRQYVHCSTLAYFKQATSVRFLGKPYINMKQCGRTCETSAPNFFGTLPLPHIIYLIYMSYDASPKLFTKGINCNKTDFTTK